MLIIKFRFFLFMLVVFLANFILTSARADTDVNARSAQENTVTTTTIQPTSDGVAATKTVETKHTVVTTIPAPNSVVSAPDGSISCMMIDAEWRSEGWIPAHKICTYANSPEGVAWVEGYWKCNVATSDGVCRNWEWVDSRWEKTVPGY